MLAADMEMDCPYTKNIFSGTKHNKYYCNGTQRFFFFFLSFGIAEHVPSITENSNRQPARVTAKSMLNATLHTTSANLRSLHHCYLYLRLHLVCTYFIYRDYLLSL